MKKSETLSKVNMKAIRGGGNSNVLYTPRSNDLNGWPYALPTTSSLIHQV